MFCATNSKSLYFMPPRFVEDSSEVPHHKNIPHLKCQEVVPHMQRSIMANGNPKHWSFAGKKEMTQDEPDGRLLVETKWGKEKCKKPITARRLADARPEKDFVPVVKFEWLQVALVVHLPNLVWALSDRRGAQHGGDTIVSPLKTNSRLSHNEWLVRKDLRSLLGKRLWKSRILLKRDIDDRGVRRLQAARVFAEIPLQKGLIDSHVFFSPSKKDGPLKFEPGPVND
jgi:hypothetical protein